jgi:hypothetical protein
MAPAARRTSVAALLVALALLPVPAQAQHRARGVGIHAQSSHTHQRFHHRPFGSRVVVVAPFVPFGFYSAATVSSPPSFYDPPPPAMYPASTAYGPTPAYAAPPAPMSPPPQLQQDLDPQQREVVFPTGRYVLRGDGITTPYTWVWIPNPPTAPPGGAQPDSGARDGERAIYAWTDGNGVTTWTDRLSRVPPEYRASARRDF